MHLGSDAVYLRHTVGLPLLYPVDEALELPVIIPVRFKVIVIDEQTERLGSAIFSIVLTRPVDHDTDIIQRSEIILPVEVV